MDIRENGHLVKSLFGKTVIRKNGRLGKYPSGKMTIRSFGKMGIRENGHPENRIRDNDRVRCFTVGQNDCVDNFG